MGFCGCPLMLDERIYLLAEGVVLFWADVKVPEMLYERIFPAKFKARLPRQPSADAVAQRPC